MSLVGQDEAAGVPELVRVGPQFQPGQIAAFADHKPGGAPVQKLSLLAYRKRSTGRLHPRALGGPRLDKPEFLRVQGMRRGESFFKTRHLQDPASTRDISNEQASDTRRPCRNIRNRRQRSRAACRPPLAASRSFSTSQVVSYFRPPFSQNGPFSAFCPVIAVRKPLPSLMDASAIWTIDGLLSSSFVKEERERILRLSSFVDVCVNVRF